MDSTNAPPIKRRLICIVYEALLLFGVAFIATFIFSFLFQSQHKHYVQVALQAWLFLTIGLYFVWLWSHGGQTLAMKTWRIQLVTKNNQSVSVYRAIIRYVLTWSWFLPGLAVASAFQAKSWLLIIIPFINIAAWALTVYLDPQRQFLHDRLAGTKLIAT